MQSIRAVPIVFSLGLLVYGAASETQKPILDPVAQLVQDFEQGRAKLPFDPKHGYLKGVLKELNIPASSQTLVWSKTSLQGPAIGPKKPRAIYFNDHTYVGWVNGGEFIEIATVHPEKGTRFYTIVNEAAPKLPIKDEFQRCIGCHAGVGLGGVPRLLARSVSADPQGYQILRGAGRIVTSKTPFNQRWGGWYVSGTHGKQRHRGNTAAVGDDDGYTFDVEAGANKTDLSPRFATAEYLSPHSDIVALMVMDHQMHVQNEIVKAGNSVRKSLSDPSTGSIAEACEPLVEALLCIGEAPLSEPIQGMGDFRRDYEKGGPLRQLDLKTRLFKLRLSPMIETASFSGLPESAKKQIFRRIKEIVNGTEFSEIGKSERAAIQGYLGPR